MPRWLGEPILHLRLGQCALELGDITKAKDELTRAYMGAGKDIFQDEPPKYFALLRDALVPPAGSNSL